MKKGYIIVRISVNDKDVFQKYPPLSSSAMEKYGGKYLIRGGRFNVLEGEWPFERTTVVEFNSYEKARQCYESTEYAKARSLRKQSAKSDFILIEGF
tara:strand:- start:266 stop:556 length:291 start_codon:yes stop_codon:yes gene_type:complete